MSDLQQMKQKFYDKINNIILTKGKNQQLFSKEKYYSLLSNVKVFHTNKKLKKKPEDYQRLARYSVIKIGNTEKLIVPVKNKGDPIIYYVHLEETFQIIHETHILIKHGGRNRMMKELKRKYKNITIELVMIYLNLCESCQRKFILPKKGFFKPMQRNAVLNSRCQIGFMDMQSQVDEDYKYIMVYEDLVSKFIQLRPLKSKCTEEVANHLLDIFTIFGAPSILQSDNDREFVNTIVEKVCEIWDDLKIVPGKSKQDQSENSFERTDQDIKKMLATWLESNNSTRWVQGLRFIQFKINRAHHSAINRSPYEAMFGCQAKIGLKPFLPPETLSKITCEEELENLLRKHNVNEDVDDDKMITVDDDGDKIMISDSDDDEDVKPSVDPLLVADKIKREIDDASVAQFGDLWGPSINYVMT